MKNNTKKFFILTKNNGTRKFQFPSREIRNKKEEWEENVDD